MKQRRVNAAEVPVEEIQSASSVKTAFENDPFGAFDEWASEADEKAYADL